MNYLELELELSKQKEILKELQSKVANCSVIIGNITQQRSQMELQYFTEYLDIGTQYTFNSYVNFRGVPTGKDNFDSLSFRSGEKIEIVKKNQKSIVVKCIKKSKVTWQDVNGQRVSVQEYIDYDKSFRVEIESLLYYLVKDQTFNNNFNSWIKRRVSLDAIGI